MKLARAWVTLVFLSFRRLLWSTNTLMVAFPLLGCALLVWRLDYQQETFEEFCTEFVIILFASFVIPICALAYATTSIGGDREDRTLLFVLVRPLPRWLVLAAKLLATTPLVLGIVVGSYWVYCRQAGEVGQQAFDVFLPAIVYMTLAYIGLFHLFAVMFRHSTIVALIYALFMEFFIGNMPGIVKRIAVNFYGRSMMYDLGADHGVQSPPAEWFVPVSAQAGCASLLGIAAVTVVLAGWVFSRREYRDLT